MSRSRSGNHEGVPLIFDVCVSGFYMWCRNRVKYLGYIPILAPYKYDDQIITFAKMVNGIVVTTDKDFIKFERSIILRHDKYEKMYTQMVKRLHEIKVEEDKWYNGILKRFYLFSDVKLDG